MKKATILLLTFAVGLNALSAQKWTEKPMGNHALITNPGGQTLGYSPASGVKILTIDGLAFKDLNRNGQLDKYEDWRLSADVRAKDLAARLTIEEIAGLMLYSKHQSKD